MPTLKTMPGPVRSLEELVALAQVIEKEAGRCYRELAATMRLREEGRLATLFEFLAAIEDKHATQAIRRIANTSGVTFAPGRITWEVAENFDKEEGSSRLLTPYRALAIAVRNEVHAFAFYTYVAAAAPSEPCRRIAEDLAKEELAHASLLRRERRKAYHAERLAGQLTPVWVPETVGELLALCINMEWRAARYHRSLVALLMQQGKDTAAFIEVAEDEEDCTREAAARLGQSLPREIEGNPPTVDGGLCLLEEAFDRYADIAGRAKDEAVMQEAQTLAERAVHRLGRVHLLMKSFP